ncbi:hypothetical protein T310_9809 [Rasamsonia emersonii CBS 393.64]|uniref:Secreted protein n=1 Tax=Rasamsonia emersonii (strain ATCC 16479 / CBS 393.64 / IMI 116815) TaxID=1408163 RepID=A0A0F4YEC8_RASE3|nr:hypothetical protein T310_9809 [Rasamsonia emersonii CBS 393.64]KKA16542.1 hypothetical protein T310_9809 [Rasamsonia emersonii CBS 393.64]
MEGWRVLFACSLSFWLFLALTWGRCRWAGDDVDRAQPQTGQIAIGRATAPPLDGRGFHPQVAYEGPPVGLSIIRSSDGNVYLSRDCVDGTDYSNSTTERIAAAFCCGRNACIKQGTCRSDQRRFRYLQLHKIRTGTRTLHTRRQSLE